MNIIQFLVNRNRYFGQNNDSVLLFKGFEYPLLFFSYLFRSLKDNQFHVEKIDFSDEKFSSLCARFETTFLGRRVIYWLGNAGEIESKTQKKLLAYLSQYTGPHQLVMYVPTTMTVTHSIPHVVLEKYVSGDVIEQLTLLFNIQISSDMKKFIKTIFLRRLSLSLDKACLLIYYYGTGLSIDFFDQWIDLFISSEKSLFSLSQYFFAQNKRAFFRQWSLIACNYSNAFWLAFWSEQLWRATELITLLEHKKMTEAKKIAFRLPFSFIKTDWKLYSSAELGSAHNFIYQLDCHIKNGGNANFLHLFYAKFLSRTFQ